MTKEVVILFSISGAETEKFFYPLDIKRWTEIKKYGKISIRNDVMKLELYRKVSV